MAFQKHALITLFLKFICWLSIAGIIVAFVWAYIDGCTCTEVKHYKLNILSLELPQKQQENYSSLVRECTTFAIERSLIRIFPVMLSLGFVAIGSFYLQKKGIT